jgi:hypothetical protein
MKTLEDYAKEAAQATRQWYGATRSFIDKNPLPPITCEEWFKRHWAKWSRHSPIKPGDNLE